MFFWIDHYFSKQAHCENLRIWSPPSVIDTLIETWVFLPPLETNLNSVKFYLAFFIACLLCCKGSCFSMDLLFLWIIVFGSKYIVILFLTLLRIWKLWQRIMLHFFSSLFLFSLLISFFSAFYSFCFPPIAKMHSGTSMRCFHCAKQSKFTLIIMKIKKFNKKLLFTLHL